MQPVNYTLSGPSVTDQLMQGFGQGQQIRQVEDKLRLAEAANQRAEGASARAAGADGRAQEAHALRMQAARQAIEEKQAAAQKQAAFQTAMGNLAQKGAAANYADYAQIVSDFPEFAEGAKEGWDSFSEVQKESVGRRLIHTGAALKSGNVDLAEKLITEYIGAAESSGDAAGVATGQAVLETMKTNPDAALASIGAMSAALGLKGAETVFGVAKDATVGAQEILPDGTTIQSLSDGTVRVTTAGGQVLQGAAAEQAVKDAQMFGVEIAGDTSGARETEKLVAQAEGGEAAEGAKALGSARIKAATDSMEAMGKVRVNLGNIDSAISAIDNGAKAGAVAKYLPNITEASASLQNAMDRMGLDVIASVTFGALSAPEMKLAMETAVPRNLNAEDLRKWLVDKRDAQEKAAEALQNAAIYLSTPGNTLNGWLKSQGKQSGTGSEPQAEPQAAPEQQVSTNLDAYRPLLKSGATDDELRRYIALAQKIKGGVSPRDLSQDDLAFIQSMSK